MKLTQMQIAEHLDMSQKTASEFLAVSGIDWKTATLDDIRIAYIRRLKQQAAAHIGGQGESLVTERILTEQVDRELKQYALDEKKASLVNVSQLDAELTCLVDFLRGELKQRDSQLQCELERLYGVAIDADVLAEYSKAALAHFGCYAGAVA